MAESIINNEQMFLTVSIVWKTDAQGKPLVASNSRPYVKFGAKDRKDYFFVFNEAMFPAIVQGAVLNCEVKRGDRGYLVEKIIRDESQAFDMPQAKNAPTRLPDCDPKALSIATQCFFKANLQLAEAVLNGDASAEYALKVNKLALALATRGAYALVTRISTGVLDQEAAEQFVRSCEDTDAWRQAELPANVQQVAEATGGQAERVPDKDDDIPF